MKLLICNLKENGTLNEMLRYKKTMENYIQEKANLVICPQFPYIPIMYSKKYILGAQNVSEEERGSFTGEVSAECLKSLGVEYIIVGHHEREIYFLENEEILKKKIQNALKQDLKVIIPIGENLMEYQLGKTEEVILDKLDYLLKDIPENKKKNIIIAYEPIWRVGKNIPLKIEEILPIIERIKQWYYEHNFLNNLVLYGGGVTPEDIKNLAEIDGFLLGKLSLNVEKMCKVLEMFQSSTSIYKS